MKSTIIRTFAAGAALAAALVTQAPARAQTQLDVQPGQRREHAQRQDPGQRLDRQVSMLTRRLGLSSSQQTQIRRILQQRDEQFRAWRESHRDQFGGQRDGQRRDGRQGGFQRGQGQRPQLLAELQAIRDRSEQQIERVLTDSQRAQYRQLRDEHGRFGERRGGERREQHGDHQRGGTSGAR
ncbi:MAG TPA: hypothetical protein VF092_23430 [Longimicrobium sp.]